MIRGHVGDAALNPYHRVTWVMRLFFAQAKKKKKKKTPHTEHSTVFPLTPHTIIK